VFLLKSDKKIIKGKMQNKIKDIKQITKDIIDLLKYNAEVMVLEEGDGVKINIISSDPSLMIGYNGQNLYALEHVVRLLANKNQEDFVYINLDVADYKNKRKSMLEDMVKKAVTQIKKDQKNVEFESLNPSERKIVHTLCQPIDGITSESTGEGQDRKIIIKVQS